MNDPMGRQIIVADGFSEPVAPHEERDPIGALLREVASISQELKETTQTPEGCDLWLNDSADLFSAVIEINLACHRIKARYDETRVQRRADEAA